MVENHKNVSIKNGFWKDKKDLNSSVTIDAVYDRFNESGRVTAFRCDWKEGMENKPHFFWDSDVAKWMEAASYIIAKENRQDLVEKIESIIDEIEKNRNENGYFNSYFLTVFPDGIFKDRNLHELYCAGHLMEAACAYYEATGRDRFLKIMLKYAEYIEKVFVKEESAAFVTPGHEEIELALYRMYKLTGKRFLLDLCAFFLENRGLPGSKDPVIIVPRHTQSHAPIREQTEAFGHAVRAMYLYSAMADYAGETGDEKLLETCRKLFTDITERKMYITGGIGSTRIGEAFTVPYDLPNATAYSETCASIGMIFFADRMFRHDEKHSSAYADIVELELFNGALSGLSLDGNRFFYENPLEINLASYNHLNDIPDKNEIWPITERVKLFSCSCCPPNIARLLASVEKYFYSFDEKTGEVYVNQFAESEYENGNASVSVSTDYPFGNTLKIKSNVPFNVRLPGWCEAVKTDCPYELGPNGYMHFTAGEALIEFDMSPRIISASSAVYHNFAKAAVAVGPFVYCAEALDNDGNVHTLILDKDAVSGAKAEHREDIGANMLTVDGFRIKDEPGRRLYETLKFSPEKTKIKMIPYFCFANRGPSDMLVWMPYR